MGGGRRRPGTEQGRWWLAPGVGGVSPEAAAAQAPATAHHPVGCSVQGAGGQAGPHRVALQALTVLQPHRVDLTGLVTLTDLRRALKTRST